MDKQIRVEKVQYRLTGHTKTAVCLATVIRLVDGRHLAIYSELLENPGMSVTNAAETVAMTIIDAFDLEIDKATFIEHYPDDNALCRTPGGDFDLVTFNWNHAQANTPRWKRMSREWVESTTRINLRQVHPIFALAPIDNR